MMNVCSNHVKDALKKFYVPHVQMISEQEKSCANCHHCGKNAKYKLFNIQKEKKTPIK